MCGWRPICALCPLLLAVWSARGGSWFCCGCGVCGRSLIVYRSKVSLPCRRGREELWVQGCVGARCGRCLHTHFTISSFMAYDTFHSWMCGVLPAIRTPTTTRATRLTCRVFGCPPPPPHDTGNMEPHTPCHRRSEVGILHPIEEVVGSDEEPEPESPIVRAPFSSSVGVCSGAVIGGGSGKCCLGLSCCGVCSPSHQWRFFLIRRSHPISFTRAQGIP